MEGDGPLVAFKRSYKQSIRCFLVLKLKLVLSNLCNGWRLSLGFSLGTPLKTYHFLAPSSEEKVAWFSDLYSNILAQKQLLSKVRTHPPVHAHCLDTNSIARSLLIA